MQNTTLLSNPLCEAINALLKTIKGTRKRTGIRYSPKDLDVLRKALVELTIIQTRFELPPGDSLRKDPEMLRKVVVQAINMNI